MDDLLETIPATLRADLYAAFGNIVRNYRERRWEPSELNGGKLCEVVYTIISGHVAGSFPTRASKPRNMLVACQALEQADSKQFSRSARIQIPRMLVALYEIRNNRGVGHVGGDVNPNLMDATAVLAMSKWLLAEVVRLFHSVSTEQAEAAVETIVDRTLPLVWVVGDAVRILNPKATMRDKTLLVLYHNQTWVDETSLVRSVEHSNPSAYRRDVLRKCHREKLLEFDETGRRVLLSPLGINFVEQMLLPKAENATSA